ncbi:unnamed protein product [Leuciscus chuanchicus]
MHTLFHNVPARREDYVTKSSVFPLSFCGHRWLENLSVVERALEVWPSLQLYVDAVKRKELPNPGTDSCIFFTTIARIFEPFLKRYQMDEPVMPFLAKDLAELMKSVPRRFVKREVLQDITKLQLTKLDLCEKKNLLLPQKFYIGLGAEKPEANGKSAGHLLVRLVKPCLSSGLGILPEAAPPFSWASMVSVGTQTVTPKVKTTSTPLPSPVQSDDETSSFIDSD